MKAFWPQKGCSSSFPTPTLFRRRSGRRGEGIGEKATRKKRYHLVQESQRFPELPPNSCLDQTSCSAVSVALPALGELEVQAFKKTPSPVLPRRKKGWVLTLSPSLCGSGSRTDPWPPSLWHLSTLSDLQGQPVDGQVCTMSRNVGGTDSLAHAEQSEHSVDS